MVFTLCTSGAIVIEAGDGVNSTASTSGAILSKLSEDAEGEFCALTRKDWVSDWANVDTRIQLAVTSAVSKMAGFNLIKYDMSGYTSRNEAQTMLDVCDDQANKIIRELTEKENQSFN